MSQKILLNEISRIHKLMGIKTSKHKILLNEKFPGLKPAMSDVLEEFSESGAAASFRNDLKTNLVDWSSQNNLLRGRNATYDEIVNAGKKMAKDAGNVDPSEALALSYVITRAGTDAFDNISDRIAKLQLKRSADILDAKARAETSNAAKNTLTRAKQNTENFINELDNGTIADLPTLKTRLEAAKTTIQSMTMTTPAVKDALTTEIDNMINYVDKYIADKTSVAVGDEIIGATKTKDLGDFIPEIQVARRLEQESADAAAEAERLAQERIAREAEEAAEKRVQKAFDDIKKGVKSERRMSTFLGFGGKDTGFLPSWLGNKEKQSVLKVIDDLEEEYKQGIVTRQQILDRADTEIKRVQEVVKANPMKIPVLSWFKKFFKEYPKLSWAILIIGIATLGTVPIYRWIKDRKREIDKEDRRQEITDCFQDVESYENLSSEQKTLFSKIFTCRNRDKEGFPDSFITEIKYVEEEKSKSLPAEFIVTVGVDVKTVKHYNAKTGEEIVDKTQTKTQTQTQTQTTSSGTITSFEDYIKKYAQQIGYTYVSGSAKDLGNNRFEGNIKYGTTEVPIQRTWNGTEWVQ